MCAAVREDVCALHASLMRGYHAMPLRVPPRTHLLLTPRRGQLGRIQAYELRQNDDSQAEDVEASVFDFDLRGFAATLSMNNGNRKILCLMSNPPTMS